MLPAKNAPRPHKGDILVVDDSLNNLHLLSTALTEMKYTVRSAASGPLALLAVAERSPDLILLDITMPEMNGYQVCQQLKANKQTQDIPVIFLSGLAESLDKVQAFAVGGVDYIAKPFSLEEIAARIENQLGRQRLQRQLKQTNEALERRVTERTEELSQTVTRLEEQISERVKTEAALQQYTDRLRVLHRIDRDILAAQTPAATAQAALNHIPDLIPCQWVGAIIFDVEANEAVLLATRVVGDISVEWGERLPLQHLGSLEDLRQGQLIVEDLPPIPALSQVDKRLMAAGLHSRIQAPLISRDELLGCLILATTTPGIFSVEHAAITEEVATQLALALDNARLHTETQRRAKELAALNKASRAMASTLDLKTVLEQTMAELRTLLGAEGASVLLHDPVSDDLVFTTVVSPDAESLTGMRLPLSKGIAGWVMQTQQPVLVDDVQHDPRFYDRIDTMTGMTTQSLLAVPLTYKNEVIGVVEVVNKGGAKFKQHDLKMLEALTSSAAIAIENARLYQDLQDRLKTLQETQQQLIQSEKMGALGRLVASITHEINNPLQAVQTCLTLTREEMAEEQRLEKIDYYLSIVESEIERVSTILHRLRDFYRPEAHGLQPTNLHIVLESVLELTHKQLQHSNIQVEQAWLDDLPDIQANANHLKQVFLNLVFNAVDAMPAGGTLGISTARGEISADNRQPARPGVRLTFKDTGQGMSAETFSHLFEPFFTTKPQGSGLGLCISYSIIESHHGQIMVDSTPNVGTIFTILLPTEQPALDP